MHVLTRQQWIVGVAVIADAFTLLKAKNERLLKQNNSAVSDNLHESI